MTKKNNQLPSEWVTVPLKEILVSLESGKRPRGGVKNIKSGVPSIGGEHLNANGGFKFEKIKYVPEKFADSMVRGHIQKNDILIVKDGATTGKTSLVKNSFPHKKAVVNEHVFLCRCVKEVDPLYLFYFLFYLEGNQQILNDFRGAAQGGISKGFANIVKVPLAPQKEQKHISCEIEKQFSRLDEAVENLKRVKANLKQYKASVLKAAVEGKLTKEWRKKHLDVEPADKLLQRILDERSKKWEAAELAKMKAAGKEPKNDKWKKKYKEPAKPELDGLPSLPDGWIWCLANTICNKIQDGTHFSPKNQFKSKKKGYFLYITAKNIKVPGIDLTDVTYIEERVHKKIFGRCNVEKNDVLLIKDGVKTGIATVNQLEEEFSLLSSVALLKPINFILNPLYLKNYLNSPLGFNLVIGKMTGTAIKRIILQKINETPVPLAPIDEQKEIISQIDKSLSIVVGIEIEIERNLKRAERLRQSILKKAFSGKLVAQDENDEFLVSSLK